MAGAIKPRSDQVHLIGGIARRALHADIDARVLAVFPRSFYLEILCGESDSESLVCIGEAGLGPGPLNLLCDIRPESSRYFDDLHPGADAQYHAHTLRVGSREFNLAGASVWSAPRPVHSASAEGLYRGLKQIGSRAARGLGRLIPFFLDHHKAPPRFDNDPVLQRVWQAGSALKGWLERSFDEPPSPSPRCEWLLGLGDGLTPAGDDFLIGMMIALRGYGQSDTADRLAAWALPLARTRTNKISISHLDCAATGEGSAVLHDTLNALHCANCTGLDRCLDALDRVGHTSGWDALAGVALATDAVARRSKQAPPLAH